MKERFEQDNQPICKFGPGGDFTYVWPPESIDVPSTCQNSLSKVLNSVAEIVTTMLGADPGAVPLLNLKSQNNTKRIFFPKEKLKYAVKNDKSNNSTSTTITKSDCKLPEQSLLFADDKRTCIRNKPKQKHRIRAHRKTSRKKPPVNTVQQGSLFETNFQGAKTA